MLNCREVWRVGQINCRCGTGPRRKIGAQYESCADTFSQSSRGRTRNLGKLPAYGSELNSGLHIEKRQGFENEFQVVYNSSQES